MRTGSHSDNNQSQSQSHSLPPPTRIQYSVNSNKPPFAGFLIIPFFMQILFICFYICICLCLYVSVVSSSSSSSSSSFLFNMSGTGTIRSSPSLRFRALLPPTPPAPLRDFAIPPRILSFSTSKDLFLTEKSPFFPWKVESFLVKEERIRVSKDGAIQELDGYHAPVSIELTPINSESHFDRVIAEAQQLEESVIIVWMANWCRKCIYLKPKLEKLAADYHLRLRFYYVDINTVPHKLVARAGVTKMPTIQLWKDGEMQDEVIGGHKAYIVINEVREMIESKGNL